MRQTPFLLTIALILTACGGGSTGPTSPPSDTINPSITLAADTTNLALPTPSVTYTATATDNVALRDVRFFDNGTLLSTDTEAPYQLIRPYSSADNGTHRIKAVATDTSANSAEAQVEVHIALPTPPTPDTQKPYVRLQSFPNGSGSFRFEVIASDNVAVKDVRFFDNGVLFNTDTTAPYTANRTYTAADNGQHVIRVVATDTSGNTEETSANVDVTVSEPSRAAQLTAVNPTITGNQGGMTTTTPTVKVIDQYGQPMRNIPVNWQVDQGQGWAFARTAVTDANGEAQADWILGSNTQQQLQATVQGLPIVQFQASATAISTQANSVHLNFATPQATAYRIAIKPSKATRNTYFAAATIQDAYFGLQRQGDGTEGMLIFSVWDNTGPATVIRTGNADTCMNFGGEGEGKSCRKYLQWTLDETFTFEATVVPAGNDADVTVIATRGNGERIDLGTIRHSGALKLTFADAFVEDYGAPSSSCLTTGERLTHVSPLEALVSGTWTTIKTASFSSYYPRTRCGNIYFSSGNGQFIFGTGGHLASDPKVNQLTLP